MVYQKDQYKLTRISAGDHWQHFVKNSPQGSIYCLPEVLEAFDIPIEYYFVTNNDRVVAAFPYIDAKSNFEEPFLPYTYYTGVMFAHSIWQMPIYNRTECVITVTERIMDELSEKYDSIYFSCHPTLTDMRGFSWFNYHRPEKGTAIITPYYSAVLIFHELDDFTTLLRAARSMRRRSYKYAIERDDLRFKEVKSTKLLLDLLQETFLRQGLSIDELTQKHILNFSNKAVEGGWGHIYIAESPSGQCLSAGLFLNEWNRVMHLPILANSSHPNAGTFLHLEVIKHCLDAGLKVFDFNGANSPLRGFFKHSFGADPQLFFEIKWEKPA